MNLLKNHRPEGREVTISEGNVVKLMVVRENPRFGIIARVKGQGRVVLWEGEDVAANIDATDEQIDARLVEKLSA
jgi:hypothetical protein